MSRKRVAVVAAVALAVVAVALWIGLGRRAGLGGRGEGAGDRGASARSSPENGEAGGSGAAGQVVRASDERRGPLRLDGQVIDEGGAPVGDALVVLSTEPPRVTRSQADGSFAFEHLVPRNFHLQAQAGDLTGYLRYRLASDSDPAILRVRLGKKVQVRVKDEAGQPIAGAAVRARGNPYLEDAFESVVTDEAGEATLRGLDSLPWASIRATAAGYAPGTGLALPDLSERATSSVQITLRRGAAVSGKVRDEAGQPIADAKVTYFATHRTFTGGGSAETRSEADGSFHFAAVSPGQYQVAAETSTHGGRAFKAIEVAGAAVTDVELTLTAGATMSGVVVQADGKPVPFAVLRAVSKQEAPSDLMRWTAADGQGRFELAGLPRGDLQLHASAERATSAIVDVAMNGALRREDVRLVLDVTGEISGVVVDDRGEPVPEVSVKAERKTFSSGADVLKASAVTLSDGSGTFVLRGLPDDEYLLLAGEARPDPRAWAADAVRPGDKGVKLVVPRMAEIAGRLVDSAGKPLPGPASLQLSTGAGPATTSTGSFRFQRLAPSTYELTVRVPGLAEVTLRKLTVAPGETLELGDIKIEAGRRVTGRVVDEKGRPVAGARVRAMQQPFSGPDDDELEEESVMDLMQGTHIATSDGHGAFELRGMPTDKEMHLIAHAAAGSSRFERVGAGTEEAAVTLTLRGQGSIEGVVTKSGKPMAEVMIMVMPPRGVGGVIQGEMRSATTGGDGRFVLSRVAEGEVEVEVARMGQMSSQQKTRVTVEAGKRAHVEIKLEGGDVSLTVEVKAKPGHRVDAAELSLFDGAVQIANGKELLERVLQGGGRSAMWMSRFPTKFGDLRPGAYTLCAVPFTGDMFDHELMRRAFEARDKHPVVCKPVAVTGAAEQKVTLELPSMPPCPRPPSSR